MLQENMNSPIWKGSIGPLYLKSHWISSSHRHFNLNKKQMTKRNYQIFRKAQSFDFEESNRFSETALQIVGSIKDNINNKHRNRSRRNEIKKLSKFGFSFEQLRRKVNENINIKNGRKLENNKKSALVNEPKENQQINESKNILRVKDEKTPQTNKIDVIKKNQLTDRVLHWLDLAGKNTLIRAETANPYLLPQHNDNDILQVLPKRRILTAESLKKPLRRAESVHHLSLTLNEVEMDLYNNRKFFEASSRCASAIKFGEFFQTTYCYTRNLFIPSRSYQWRGISLPSLPVNHNNLILKMEEIKVKRISDKKKQQQLLETQNMEKEYKSMIHRQILENSCNTQNAKKQLHIFMPNLPKKQVGSQDNDSSLSTLVSDPANK